MSTIPLPFDSTAFPCIRVVSSFDELLATRFSKEINALCWPRQLAGDFAEIEQSLPPIEDITTLDEEDLHDLKLGPAGKLARDHLLRDQHLLSASGLQPSLDLVPPGEQDLGPDPIRTDVADWHVDSATVETDTFLCTYHGAPSEGVSYQEATCQVEVPATREILRKHYGGPEGEGFETFLKERFYNLHYTLKPGAPIFSFGVGHLWRVATQYPDSPVSPCIHRAPTTDRNQPRRLLLIS
ncbi:DUF1826 domain-containing protein [Opitutaceae bacterium]|nr:DUF1826 domain-containing protein [Opitutaceae bacterium]MDB4474065.1 DUF1826 domain-containing protein [Opitutaceae bacterium]